ncbi:MAG TPA: hypothetical protein VH275_09680 [Solirubrobacterales bacterium]|nr:hypothetical protein [Solirubrobacterales bacterium]
MLAMVSTGYAAFKLPKNSVGTKQIKKNAVTGAKVKNQSLSGSDIKLGTLGTVPSATNAAHATAADRANLADRASVAELANSISPLEATHLVGTAGQPGFESGSANLPSEAGVGYQPVGFYKDHEGIVHLQGVVNVGATGALPGVIFRLPSGFRPRSGTLVVLNVFCSRFVSSGCGVDEGGAQEAYASIVVGGSSTVLSGQNFEGAIFAPTESTVSLDGVTFRAEG